MPWFYCNICQNAFLPAKFETHIKINTDLLFVCLFVCFIWALHVAFNNLSVILQQCLDVAGSSVLTFRVLLTGISCPRQLTWYSTQSHYTDIELTSSSSTFLMLSAKWKAASTIFKVFGMNSARDQTCNFLVTKLTLYQLSHFASKYWSGMMERHSNDITKYPITMMCQDMERKSTVKH